MVGLSIAAGAFFGLVALVLIESMRGLDRLLRRFNGHPYAVAAAGGVALSLFYLVAGPQYAGLGTPVIESALRGVAPVVLGAFVLKIVATTVTLETGGSGGIVTPLFFIGSTAGAAAAQVLGLPSGAFAVFGFVSVLAAAANPPIAAAVMGMELLPGPVGVFAALSAGVAFLIVGHRSVYPSQRLGFSKSAGLDMTLDVPVGAVASAGFRVRRGSLTDRVHRLRLRGWRGGAAGR
jgi:H+/Cl- antiporter ClcA